MLIQLIHMFLRLLHLQAQSFNPNITHRQQPAQHITTIFPPSSNHPEWFHILLQFLLSNIHRLLRRLAPLELIFSIGRIVSKCMTSWTFPRSQRRSTYCAEKPCVLGAPVSPAPMVDRVVVRDRTKRGVDAEARMRGRERKCMVMLKPGGG